MSCSRAEAWETKLLGYFKSLDHELQVTALKISFSIEVFYIALLDIISHIYRIQSREHADVSTIVLSYAVMFIYASFALGKIHF